MNEIEKSEFKKLCLEIFTENNAKIFHNKYKREELVGVFLNKLSKKYKGYINGEVVRILKKELVSYKTTDDY